MIMFVTLSVAAMVSMAAYSDDALALSRTTFENCIVESTIEHLGKKISEKDFSKAVKSACQVEKDAFYQAVMTAEIQDGSSSKEATTYAREEVDMTIEDSVVNYAEHLSAGTTPGKAG